MVAEESSLRPRAKELVAALNTFLGAFVGEQDLSGQEAHLQDVAVECAKFGYLIFSQLAEFAWKFGTDTDKQIVVCPGLDKVTDDQGRRISPESVAAPEISKL